MKNKNTEAVLNDLIQLCRDGEKGYREAAESINNAYHKMLLQEFGRQRSAFGTVLQGYVRAYGGDPERKGSMIGNLHRGWMNFESAIGKNDDREIISECTRGEEMALKHYEHARSSELPLDVMEVLKMQSEQIHQALEKLKAMQIP